MMVAEQKLSQPLDFGKFLADYRAGYVFGESERGEKLALTPADWGELVNWGLFVSS